MNHATTYRTSGWPATAPVHHPTTAPLRDRLRHLLRTPAREHGHPAPPGPGTT